jgi:hypothetical protein
MRREDAEKLLGGHAAGTLTDAERRALMEAALADQELFDALAGEEALRELLEDPEARRLIEQAVAPGETPQTGFAAWLRRPRSWTLVGALAAAAVITVAIVWTGGPERRRETFELAKRSEPAVPELPPGAAPLAPAPAPERRVLRDQTATPAKPQNGPAAPQSMGGGGGALQPSAGLTPSEPGPAIPAPIPPAAESMAKARADALSAEPEEKQVKGELAAQEAAPERGITAGAPSSRDQRVGQAARPAVTNRTELAASLVSVPPPSLRYAITTSAQGAALLTVNAGQRGYLYALGSSGLIYSGPVEPGKPAVISAPSGTGRVSLLFSRTEAADPRALLSHRPATTESNVPGGKRVEAAAPASFVAADVDLSR